MVVLTLSNFLNGSTVHLPNGIQNPKYVRLVSMSMYNSWNNFEGGTITSTETLQSGGTQKAVSNVLAGFYTIQSFSKTIQTLLKDSATIKFTTRGVRPKEVFTLENADSSKIAIELSENFSKVFKIVSLGGGFRFEKKNQPRSHYFVHCDIIEKEKNLYNGFRSDLLECLNTKGEPYEVVVYHKPTTLMKSTISTPYIDSVKISVKNHDGELFNFNGFELEIILEII